MVGHIGTEAIRINTDPQAVKRFGVSNRLTP